MATSSIIRFGPTDNNLGAQLLRKAITSFFQEKNDIIDDKVDDGSCFVIQNKYFSANIRLEDIEMIDGSSRDENDANTTGEMEDGVILVFDALQSNPDRVAESSEATFDSLHGTHQKAAASNACGDQLRLCVGVSLSEVYSPSEIRGKDHEKEYSRRILWCLDHGYEYIEADISVEGLQKGHGDRDKDGFARIIEAIQGTVWSSAAMSKAKSNVLKDTFADTKATIQEKEESSSSVPVETEDENPYIPPDPSLLTAAISTANEQTKDNADDIAAVFGLKEEPTGMDDKDMEAEKMFSQMESVLKEAAQIRQASKNGALSDEERRDRAGEAALALVNLMGQFGLDDDGEDSEGYGSDDSLVE